MEKSGLIPIYRVILLMLLIGSLALTFFVFGVWWGKSARAAEPQKRVIYRDTKLDFEGISIRGELKSPSEFYFLRRKEEKFRSLVQRRKNFHKEMLRDVVLGK